MSVLFTLPKQYLVDQAGAPLMGGKAWFYRINTDTPQDSYTSRALSVPHSNPVQADAYGVLPPIWLDQTGFDYRLKVTDIIDVVQYTVDGVIGAQTPLEILDDLKTVDGAGSGLDADLLDGVDASEFVRKDISQTITGFHEYTQTPWFAGFEAGFRLLPQLSKTAQYTLNVADMSKEILITTGGILIPVHSTPFNVITVGSAILVYNDSALSQTIQATVPATTTIRRPGTAATGAVTLAQYGLAMCHKVKQEVWLVYGPGVS